MAPQQNGEDPLRRLREDPLLLAYQPAPELPSEADEAFNALIREWIVHNEPSLSRGGSSAWLAGGWQTLTNLLLPHPGVQLTLVVFLGLYVASHLTLRRFRFRYPGDGAPPSSQALSSWRPVRVRDPDQALTIACVCVCAGRAWECWGGS